MPTNQNTLEPKSNELTPEIARKEGNFAIGTGFGVGALGIGAAAITGAVCPLCYVIPPLLVGYGLYHKTRGVAGQETDKPDTPGE